MDKEQKRAVHWSTIADSVSAKVVDSAPESKSCLQLYCCNVNIFASTSNSNKLCLSYVATEQSIKTYILNEDLLCSD